jgi:hypothetical protein
MGLLLELRIGRILTPFFFAVAAIAAMVWK